MGKQSAAVFIAQVVAGTKALCEVMAQVACVPYCIDLIGGPYIETHPEVIKAFRPKSLKYLMK